MFADLSVWCRMFLVIDRKNCLMSNWIKLQLPLSVMLLSHFKAVLVWPNWLNCSFSTKSEFIFSRSCLLTFPSLFFDGFIKRHVGLEWKLSLWSLSVTKAGVLAMLLTLLLIFSWVDMLFASRLIGGSSFCIAFW